jgi:hypothetical protein
MAERPAKVQHEAQGATKQKGHNLSFREGGERENADANKPPHRLDLLPSYKKREVHREGRGERIQTSGSNSRLGDFSAAQHY